MGKIGIITLLVLCLILLLLSGCVTNTIIPEIDNGNFGNQEDIIQSSNNSQIVDTEEPATEEPGTVYPQKWATGDGTVENPWANDCIQKAYDFAPDGGTIFLKEGYYILAAQLTISKQINIFGEGINKTIVEAAAGTVDGFYIEVDYVTVKNLTVDGDAQTDGGGGAHPAPIRIVNCDYVVLEDIEVKNAGVYGMDIFQVNHSSFQNIHAHDNFRHGMHPGSNRAGRNKYNTYRDIYCWNNGVDGFDDRGGPDSSVPFNNIYDNLHCWDNGEQGIAIGSQSGGSLTNSFTYGNGKCGMYIYYFYNSTIDNCSADSNFEHGIWLIRCDNVNLSNVIAKNNGIVGGGNCGGVKIYNTPSTKLSLCQLYDDGNPMTQDYAIITEGITKDVDITNCKLTPNEDGSIRNDAGAVVTVITEKMLAKF